jgi:hypothetical protein
MECPIQSSQLEFLLPLFLLDFSLSWFFFSSWGGAYTQGKGSGRKSGGVVFDVGAFGLWCLLWLVLWYWAEGY